MRGGNKYEDNEYTIDKKVIDVKQAIQDIVSTGTEYASDVIQNLIRIRDICDQIITATEYTMRDIKKTGKEIDMTDVPISKAPQIQETKKKNYKPKIDKDGNEIYDTTKEHFDIFRKHAMKWIRYFGLTRYQVIFDHENFEGRLQHGLASCSICQNSMSVRLGLNVIWHNMPPTKYEIEKSAFHEVAEIITGEYRDLLSDIIFDDKLVTQKQMDQANHTLIQTLVTTVWQDLKDKI